MARSKMNHASTTHPDALPLARADALEERPNEEGLRVLRFLEERISGPVTPSPASVARGREGILNRLAARLLREDLAGCASDAPERRIDSTQAADGPSKDAHQQGSFEDLLGALGLKPGRVLKTLPISGGESLVVAGGGFYTFGRLEVEGPIFHVRAGVFHVRAGVGSGSCATRWSCCCGSSAGRRWPRTVAPEARGRGSRRS